MAASMRRFFLFRRLAFLNANYRQIRRDFVGFQWSNEGSGWQRPFKAIGGGFLVVATAFYAKVGFALTESRTKQPIGGPNLNEASKPRLTQRERRFVKFASVEYDGQLYMTPQDFLESVTESEPRPRLKRRVLTTRDIESVQNAAPPVRKGSPTFFRSLRDQGVISYTEYLFLLSILTKPHSGFHIAFNMFDTDGNKQVDREEFLVLERIFCYARLAREKARRRAAKGQVSGGGGGGGQDATNFEDDEEELAMDAALKEELANVVNTTLIVHFFGKKGQGMLCYDDFRRFMENLQTEVLQIEFNEFSKGLPTISELDFAKILLRYTLLHSDDYDAYLTRLVQRIQHKQGITFEEFKTFCQFLNNLEDFGIAMRMYTLADRPISKEEFNRAVKICTGQSLSNHLVETVFQIFDEDDDGQLSYKEFIAIMRDRLHRGIKRHTTKNEGWDAFKSCVKQEMRNAM